jgi:hypothetical protein
MRAFDFVMKFPGGNQLGVIRAIHQSVVSLKRVACGPHFAGLKQVGKLETSVWLIEQAVCVVKERK